MVELSLLKGTKDRLPKEEVLREKIIDIVKQVFQLYGFQPAATPILEMWDVLASKYAGGAEILKETYRLTDQGERELGLRYDLSIPLARLIGMNPHITKPFKRYEIGLCFRDGPIKKGRYREFMQCDVDVVGTSSMLADAECLAVAHQVFSKLGLETYLEVNNRKLLTGILIAAGVSEDLLQTAILSIDKMKKIGMEGVREEMEMKGVPSDLTEVIFTFFSYEGEYLTILNQLEPRIKNEIGKQGIAELKELYHYLELFGIADDVKLLYSLARGLEIYTGTVFEAFLKDLTILDSSLCAGGRYDEIISKFLGTNTSKEQYSAVGISFGVDTIYDAVAASWSEKPSITEVFIIHINALDTAIKLATELRHNNIKTELDLMSRKLSKNLEYANRQAIPYVIIVGKRDLAENRITIREMTDGTEHKIELLQVVDKLNHLLIK